MRILVIYRQCGFWIILINTGNDRVWIFTLIALRRGSSKFIFRVNDLLKLPYKIPYKFDLHLKESSFWGKIQLIFQDRQMKLRTHHLTPRSWKTRFRCQWKNPLQFQIKTPIQFHILNLRCWRIRCDFKPGIHIPH